MLSRLCFTLLLLGVPLFGFVSASADFLYLLPVKGGLDYAVLDSGELEDLDLCWTPGYRVELDLGCRSLYFGALYTHFCSKDSVRKEGENLAMTRIPGILALSSASLASPELKVRYDVVDLLLHYPTGCLTPFVGARLAYIDQEMKTLYRPNNPPGESINVQEIDMRGYGLRAGMHFCLGFFSRPASRPECPDPFCTTEAFSSCSSNAPLFSFFVTPSLSIIRAHFNGHSSFDNLASGSSQALNYEFNYTVPSFALDTGFEVSLCNLFCGNVVGSIGYTVEGWWLQDFVRLETESSQYFSKEQTLFGFQGVFARLQVRF